MRECILCTLALAVASLVTLTSANASNIATIEAQPTGTPGLTIDSGPVVTAIVSQPGTFNGKTYTSWSFLINDGTGSLHVYASAAVLSGLGYTPTVGDAITVTGTYSPYHQIPQLTTPTAISVSSSGNAIPAPLTKTISAIKQSPLPLDIGGYMVELDQATITGQSGFFGTTDSPPSATITDATGSMKLYYWPGTFSAANSNLFGQAIPTDPVSVIGFVSIYSGAAEFNPISIVPEPVAVSLLAMGGLALFWRQRN